MKVTSLRLVTTLCAVLASSGGRRCYCQAGWVDPDTPDEFRTTTSNFAKDRREFELVRELSPHDSRIICAPFSFLFTSFVALGILG